MAIARVLYDICFLPLFAIFCATTTNGAPCLLLGARQGYTLCQARGSANCTFFSHRGPEGPRDRRGLPTNSISALNAYSCCCGSTRGISWIRRRCRCVSIPRISARLSAPIIAASPRWPAGLPRLSPNTWATASSSATRRRMGTTRRARSRWAWRSSTRSAPSAYRIARDSDELDAHPTHTEHDHRRNEPGDNRAADHEPVGERLGDAVRHHDPTRADRKMGEDEECAEPIMRHEADVPLVLDESGWRARRCPRRADPKGRCESSPLRK